MSFYYADWAMRDRWVMQMHCITYRYDGTGDQMPAKQRAFRHHNHEMLEILAVRTGELKVELDGKKYHLRAGDAVVVNPFQLHYGEWICNGRQNEYVCLTVDLSTWLSIPHSRLPECAEQLLSGHYRFREWLPKEDNTNALERLSRIESLFGAEGAAKESLLAAELYLLLGERLADGYGPCESEAPRKKDVEFMRQVSEYLVLHYAEPISTADIAGALFLTVPCFCYTFKRYFDMSFLNYLCQYRVTRAIELYREREQSLSELAVAVGFSDYGYFSRCFKKYTGEAPAVYFGRWKK